MIKALLPLFSLILTVACSASAPADGLVFDASSGKAGSIELPTGKTVNYTAYEKLYFVTNVEDPTYQYMNVYVPDGATQETPIFLRTYVGGYMASEAAAPQAGDATGRALAEGYVVAIPGSRGRNSKVGETWTGRAPAAILDLKAAIRYLRHFDKQMPGDAERIITDGTSAGGAMSALMGATGNYPDYEPLLDAMGAAKERDDVFASICFCPIIDLEHADMAYEWLFKDTDSRRAGSEEQQKVSAELAAQFPAYLASLDLHATDGTPLTAANFLDYIKELLIASAQKAKNAGADISADLGFQFNSESRGRFAAPLNGGMPMMRMGGGRTGEYITDLDMSTYLNYVVSMQPLKGVPSFDSKGVLDSRPSGENEEFGDATGSSVNFTEYGAAANGTSLTEVIRRSVYLLNPMNFIGDSKATNAPHWYVRHGSRDRDTSFPIPVAFATKLENAGLDVDFLLAWNRPHSGDYALDEVFDWIRRITTR
ncbi:MAG: alpha/beta hydrolase [Bacteroidales bacterium]|nr:alpha/beta hydrolase [Bacteroidales bacterium]